jgi:hypothetical protein
MVLATFWAIFSQTHLVTLMPIHEWQIHDPTHGNLKLSSQVGEARLPGM